MQTPLRITSVVGARPNFMKIAPFVHAIEAHNASDPARRIEHRLVHTGQHYDANMSKAFFDALNIPKPDIDLEIGSGTHSEQVGRTMIAFEADLDAWRPDWVIVVGDVNATSACAITARKAWIKLGHIEAGLRSFDERMPEEINRLVTDRLSNLLFTPDAIADQNLRNEGVPEARIQRVGNIMIDTLDAQRSRAEALVPADIVRDNLLPGQDTTCERADWQDGGFGVVTLHRPSNVDTRETLEPLVRFLKDAASPRLPLIWTVHPRTEARIRDFGLWEELQACRSIALVSPVGYHDMLRLNMGARLLLTDSGGLQEECCVLGTPCVTLRENTERPITLEAHDGVSRLVGNDIQAIRTAFTDFLAMEKAPNRPELWDGHTAERIVSALINDEVD